MPMQDDIDNRYAEMTDSSRSFRQVRHASTDTRWNRVKPDPETNPNVAFDYE
jgi:hypothetical protein